MSPVPSSVSVALAQLRTIATPIADYRVASFGVEAIDSRLAAGGLRAGGLHEATAGTASLVDDAAATLFLAGIAGREATSLRGVVLWATCRSDLYAPALEQAGLPAAHVIYAQTRDDAALLAVIEDESSNRTSPTVLPRRIWVRKACAPNGRPSIIWPISPSC